MPFVRKMHEYSRDQRCGCDEKEYSTSDDFESACEEYEESHSQMISGPFCYKTEKNSREDSAFLSHQEMNNRFSLRLQQGAGLIKIIEDEFIQKKKFFEEYLRDGYNTRLNDEVLSQAKALLYAERSGAHQPVSQKVLMQVSQYLQKISALVFPAESTYEIREATIASNALTSHVITALQAIDAASAFGGGDRVAKVDEEITQHLNALATETIHRLNSYPVSSIGSDNYTKIKNELMGLLFSRSNEHRVENAKYKKLKNSLLAEDRVLRNKMAAWLDYSADQILMGAREAREFAMRRLHVRQLPPIPGPAAFIPVHSASVREYDRYMAAIDGKPTSENTLTGSFRAEQVNEPLHIRVARAMLPLSEILAEVVITLRQESADIRPAAVDNDENEESQREQDTSLFRLTREKLQAQWQGLYYGALSTGSMLKKGVWKSRPLVGLKPSVRSEGVKNSVKETILMLLDEIYQIERRLKLIPGVAWELQEAVEQHQNLTTLTVHSVAMPELNAVLDEQLAVETARWQSKIVKCEEQLHVLLAPVMVFAQSNRKEAWCETLAKVLTSRQAETGEEQGIKKIKAVITLMGEELSVLAQDIESSGVRLARHGHAGGEDLVKKVRRWLHDLHLLKAVMSEAVVKVTGDSMTYYSRAGMLARGVAQWAEELKQDYLREMQPEDPQAAVTRFEQSLMRMMEDNYPTFRTESDPGAKDFLQRLKLELRHAADKTTSYPPTPEEILRGTRRLTDDIRYWAQKKFMSGAISAATRQGFKVISSPVSLSGQIVLRSARTGLKIYQGLKALDRGIRFGQGPATRFKEQFIETQLSGAMFRLTLSLSPLASWGLSAAITVERLTKEDKYARKFVNESLSELPGDMMWRGVFSAGSQLFNGVFAQATKKAIAEQLQEDSLVFNDSSVMSKSISISDAIFNISGDDKYHSAVAHHLARLQHTRSGKALFSKLRHRVIEIRPSFSEDLKITRTDEKPYSNIPLLKNTIYFDPDTPVYDESQAKHRVRNPGDELYHALFRIYSSDIHHNETASYHAHCQDKIDPCGGYDAHQQQHVTKTINNHPNSEENICDQRVNGGDIVHRSERSTVEDQGSASVLAMLSERKIAQIVFAAQKGSGAENYTQQEQDLAMLKWYLSDKPGGVPVPPGLRPHLSMLKDGDIVESDHKVTDLTLPWKKRRWIYINGECWYLMDRADGNMTIMMGHEMVTLTPEPGSAKPNFIVSYSMSRLDRADFYLSRIHLDDVKDIDVKKLIEIYARKILDINTRPKVDFFIHELQLAIGVHIVMLNFLNDEVNIERLQRAGIQLGKNFTLWNKPVRLDDIVRLYIILSDYSGENQSMLLLKWLLSDKVVQGYRFSPSKIPLQTVQEGDVVMDGNIIKDFSKELRAPCWIYLVGNYWPLRRISHSHYAIVIDGKDIVINASSDTPAKWRLNTPEFYAFDLVMAKLTGKINFKNPDNSGKVREQTTTTQTAENEPALYPFEDAAYCAMSDTCKFTDSEVVDYLTRIAKQDREYYREIERLTVAERIAEQKEKEGIKENADSYMAIVRYHHLSIHGADEFTRSSALVKLATLYDPAREASLKVIELREKSAQAKTVKWNYIAKNKAYASLLNDIKKKSEELQVLSGDKGEYDERIRRLKGEINELRASNAILDNAHKKKIAILTFDLYYTIWLRKLLNDHQVRESAALKHDYTQLSENDKYSTYYDAVKYTLLKVENDPTIPELARINAHEARMGHERATPVDINGYQLINCLFIPDAAGAKTGVLIDMESRRGYYYVNNKDDLPYDLQHRLPVYSTNNKLLYSNGPDSFGMMKQGGLMGRQEKMYLKKWPFVDVFNHNEPARTDIVTLSKALSAGFDQNSDFFKSVNNDPSKSIYEYSGRSDYHPENTSVLTLAAVGKSIDDSEFKIIRVPFTWDDANQASVETRFLRGVAHPAEISAEAIQEKLSINNGDSLEQAAAKIAYAKRVGQWIDTTASLAFSFIPGGAILTVTQAAGDIAADISEGNDPDSLAVASLIFSLIPEAKVVKLAGDYGKVAQGLVKYGVRISGKIIDTNTVGRSLTLAIQTGDPLFIYQACISGGMSAKDAALASENIYSKIEEHYRNDAAKTRKNYALGDSDIQKQSQQASEIHSKGAAESKPDVSELASKTDTKQPVITIHRQSQQKATRLQTQILAAQNRHNKAKFMATDAELIQRTRAELNDITRMMNENEQLPVKVLAEKSAAKPPHSESTNAAYSDSAPRHGHISQDAESKYPGSDASPLKHEGMRERIKKYFSVRRGKSAFDEFINLQENKWPPEKIEKKIHMIWIGTRNISDKNIALSKETALKNPGYVTTVIYDSAIPGHENAMKFMLDKFKGTNVEVVDFRKKDYFPDVKNEPTFSYYQQTIEQRKYAQASDLLRLYALKYEGGIYKDVDDQQVKGFGDLAFPKGIGVMREYAPEAGKKSAFPNTPIASSKGNKIIQTSLELAEQNYKLDKKNVLELAGPDVFTQALFQEVPALNSSVLNSEISQLEQAKRQALNLPLEKPKGFSDQVLTFDDIEKFSRPYQSIRGLSGYVDNGADHSWAVDTEAGVSSQTGHLPEESTGVTESNDNRPAMTPESVLPPQTTASSGPTEKISTTTSQINIVESQQTERFYRPFGPDSFITMGSAGNTIIIRAHGYPGDTGHYSAEGVARIVREYLDAKGIDINRVQYIDLQSCYGNSMGPLSQAQAIANKLGIRVKGYSGKFTLDRRLDPDDGSFNKPYTHPVALATSNAGNTTVYHISEATLSIRRRLGIGSSSSTGVPETQGYSLGRRIVIVPRSFAELVPGVNSATGNEDTIPHSIRDQDLSETHSAIESEGQTIMQAIRELPPRSKENAGALIGGMLVVGGMGIHGLQPASNAARARTVLEYAESNLLDIKMLIKNNDNDFMTISDSLLEGEKLSEDDLNQLIKFIQKVRSTASDEELKAFLSGSMAQKFSDDVPEVLKRVSTEKILRLYIHIFGVMQ